MIFDFEIGYKKTKAPHLRGFFCGVCRRIVEPTEVLLTKAQTNSRRKGLVMIATLKNV